MRQNIQDIVLQNIVTYGVSSSGWHSVYCEYCGDGARVQGPRGGWNFSGEACFYHCFNCGVDANFDPTREFPYSRDMHAVFKSFGLEYKDYNRVVIDYKLDNNIEIVKPEKKKYTVKYQDIPDYFVPLRLSKKHRMFDKAVSFLKTKHMNFRDYPFYLSTGKTESKNPDDITKAKYLASRLIIPIFKHDNFVDFQARDLTGKSKNKYIGGNKQIIYGFDNLYKEPESPLFITEGFFDAYHLNGVATMENNMTASQIDIINQSNKRKIVVPDKFNDAQELALKAIDLGWEVAIPDIGNCKDVVESIEKYGKLYTLNSVMSNIHSGEKAKIILKNSY